jgi:hypothetical protein
MHAWTAYKEQAWGYDDLKPLSGGGDNWNRAQSTIYDALGTLWLSGQVMTSPSHCISW